MPNSSPGIHCRPGDLPGPGKVLLMDDEEMVRAVVGEMLKSAGHEVEYAKDGKEAIALYVKARMTGNPFSAVIVDLNVPGGMGGRETMEKLRQIDRDVKAVVSSGYPHDPVMTNFREYGFRAVISKPFRVSDLRVALQSLNGEAYSAEVTPPASP